MLKQLLELFLEKLNEREKKDLRVDSKVLELVKEIDKLEVKCADALASVERYGDINDPSDYRTVEYNRIRRIIEAKRGLLNTLTK